MVAILEMASGANGAVITPMKKYCRQEKVEIKKGNREGSPLIQHLKHIKSNAEVNMDNYDKRNNNQRKI